MKLYQKILIGILGVFALPTIAMGGSLTISLIQGKSVEEAIQILAEQMDSLLGRVEVLESKQAKQELWQKKEEACRYAEELNHSIPPPPEEIKECCWWGPKLNSCADWRKDTLKNKEINKEIYGEDPDILRSIFGAEWKDGLPLYPLTRPTSLGVIEYDTLEKLYKWTGGCPGHPDLKVLKPAYEKYLQAKQKCDELAAQYNSLNQ